LHSSPNIVRMMKSRWLILAGHAACMEAKRNAYMILGGQTRRTEMYTKVGSIKLNLK
jgi:hypothetical protein